MNLGTKKLVGQKAPLKLKDIWATRIRLQLGRKVRDLAQFNLAIGTVRYLGIEVDDALEIAEQTDV